MLKDKILGVISGPKIAAVATAVEKPRVRYMVTVGFEDLSLKAATRRPSTKISRISKNPEVALTIWSGEGMKDVGEGKPYVIIDAFASMVDDAEEKKEFWNPTLEKHFKGPEDPEYVLLNFKPRRIEYYDPAKGEMDVWTE